MLFQMLRSSTGEEQMKGAYNSRQFKTQQVSTSEVGWRARSAVSATWETKVGESGVKKVATTLGNVCPRYTRSVLDYGVLLPMGGTSVTTLLMSLWWTKINQVFFYVKKKKKKIIILCVWVVYLHICLYTCVCMPGARGQRGCASLLGLESPRGCWETNQVLEKQSELFRTKPFLQSKSKTF